MKSAGARPLLLVALVCALPGLLGAQDQDLIDHFPFPEEEQGAQTPAEPVVEPPIPAVFPPADGRQRIELRVPEEKGGGTIVGVGGTIGGVVASGETQGARVAFEDRVEIRYQDLRIQADRIEYDSESGDLFAEGNVIFDQGPRRLSASGFELNLETELGVFFDVVGYVSNDYYFTGRRVEKTGEDTYVVEDGTFTSCAGVNPPWSFKTRRVKITVDKYARAHGATFRVKKAPLFYLPYILWPVQSDRSSGILIPKPGYSTRRGPSLGLAYYQTFGRSYDATLDLDLYFRDYAPVASSDPEAGSGQGNYFGVGSEVRYFPSAGTSGQFEGYAIRDPERDDWRWRMRWDHRSEDLPGGWRGIVLVEDVSDFDYFLDFERRGDHNSRRQVYSTGFLTKNLGPHSFNILLDRRLTFISRTEEVELTQLPELEYKLRSTRLGSAPLYLSMRAAAHYLDVDRGERQQVSYSRGDVFPELTLPVRIRPWLSLAISGGARLTHWEDSLFAREELIPSAGEPAPTSDFRGEALTRFVPTASAEIVGPSFSRIFEGGGGRYVRYKHVIEPRFDYGYIDAFDEEERIPLFDEVDVVRGRNRGRMALVNRLLAKEGGEDGGAAKEILALELFREISFDDELPLQSSANGLDTTQEGPLGLLLRFNPSRRTSVQNEVSYNTLFSNLEDISFSATFGLRQNDSLGLRWTIRRDPERDLTQGNQVRLSAQLSLVPRVFQVASQVTYDIETKELQFQRYFFNFQGSCYHLSLELADLRNGDRRDREYRFLVSLKNVGTFLDMSGGESERF